MRHLKSDILFSDLHILWAHKLYGNDPCTENRTLRISICCALESDDNNSSLNSVCQNTLQET